MTVLIVMLAVAASALAVVLLRRRTTSTPAAAPVVELAVISHAPRPFRHLGHEDLVYVTPRLVEQDPTATVQPEPRPTPLASTSVDNAMAVALPDRSSPFAAPILRSSRIALPDDGAEMDFFGTGATPEPSRQYLSNPGGSAMQSPLTNHRAS